MHDESSLTGAPKHFAVAMLLMASMVGFVAAVFVPRAPRGETVALHARMNVKIDLNTASVAELEALPRIGPSLARRIVEDRETHGPFRTVEELDRLKGIGKRTLELLRPYATVTGSDE